MYTNRSLAYHNMDMHDEAFNDAQYVINNIDGGNTKALYRRAIYYKNKN